MEEKFDRLFDRLPKELEILISEYNANHREDFEANLSQISLSAVRKRVSNIMRKNTAIQTGNENEYWENIVNFLRETVSDPETFVSAYNNCDCCKRHQTSRPKTIADTTQIPLFGFYIDPKPENVRRKICFCNCRHVSRNMCRAYYGNYL